MCTMMLEWLCDGGPSCAGNAWCAAVWLGNYNRNTQPIDFKDDEKIKEFIVAKVRLIVYVEAHTKLTKYLLMSV